MPVGIAGHIPVVKVSPNTDQGRQDYQEWRKEVADYPRMPPNLPLMQIFRRKSVISSPMLLVSVGVRPF